MFAKLQASSGNWNVFRKPMLMIEHIGQDEDKYNDS